MESLLHHTDRSSKFPLALDTIDPALVINLSFSCVLITFLNNDLVLKMESEEPVSNAIQYHGMLLLILLIKQ